MNRKQYELIRKNRFETLSDYDIVKTGCPDEQQARLRFEAFNKQKTRIQAEMAKKENQTGTYRKRKLSN